jgi:hypothetical protein
MAPADPRTPAQKVNREILGSLEGGKGASASPAFLATNQGVRGDREDREANHNLRVYATDTGVRGSGSSYALIRFCLPILPKSLNTMKTNDNSK